MIDGRLDLSAKIYHPRLRDRVRRVAAGERLKAPIVVDLDPTSYCDLACPECISTELLQRGRLTRERLVELADEMVSAGVSAVVLIGGGEPLAHPATATVIETLGRHRIQVGLVTNGTMIRRHLDELAQYCAWTRVSVDAATPETYRLVRPGRGLTNVFDKVIANIALLARQAKGAVGYSFMVSSHELSGGGRRGNWMELSAAATLAKSIGCGYIEFKAAMFSDHHIAPHSEAVIESLTRQIEEARRLTSPDFAVEISSSLQVLLDGRQLSQPKEYSLCSVAELRTLITPSGAYVCPYHRGNSRMLLGDPHHESLTNLWANADTSVVNPAKDCPFHCARHHTNQELNSFLETPGTEDEGRPYDPFI